MFRRIFGLWIIVFFTFFSVALANTSTADLQNPAGLPKYDSSPIAVSGEIQEDPNPSELPQKIPHVAILIINHTESWQQPFWMDGLKDLFLDRYSYLMSPASLEVVEGKGKVDLSKEALKKYAAETKADQVIVLVVERADDIWLPSWHIGSQTNFDSDDYNAIVIFLRAAMYQPSTDKYSSKKQWENTRDDVILERVLRDNTFELIKKLEKDVPPLL